MSWRSAYHRISDDSVSSYGGHETYEEALSQAIRHVLVEDIDEVWVRDPEGNVVWTRKFKTDMEVLDDILRQGIQNEGR